MFKCFLPAVGAVDANTGMTRRQSHPALRASMSSSKRQFGQSLVPVGVGGCVAGHDEVETRSDVFVTTVFVKTKKEKRRELQNLH
jgi:hypothetical protein